MAANRYSVLKSLRSSINPTSKLNCFRAHESSAEFITSINQTDARPTFACINRHYNTTQDGSTHFSINNGASMMNLVSPIDYHYKRTNRVSTFSSTLSSTRLQSNSSLFGISPLLNYRSYSSSSSNQGANSRIPEVPAASSPDAGSSGISGNDWVDKAKDAWQSVVDAATFTGQKAKEASNEVTPYVEQLLNTHPYLRDVIVPVGGTFLGTLLAWAVLPRVLKRFHKYSNEGPAVLLSESTVWGPVPYEKSFWGALEDPLRYLVTFMAFAQIAAMVAPTTIASQYLAQTWRGAVILSLVWFLHRWKTNVISRSLAVKSVVGIDRDKLLTVDKISSVGLFVLGLMALAEACGVAVQSIITVGGIGGVATAFAARDILGNVLSGLSVQLSRPFSIGDTIKAGSVEGQVVEMGLTTTSLLSAERFPVIVPNSLFSSQVIINKSRAGWRAVVTKIPLQIDDFEKIPQISDDIKTMLKSNSNVFLEKEAPYCFLSRIGGSFAELTLGCNLKYTSKDKLLATEQDILLQSARIIKQHGASLGSTLDDSYNP